MATVVAGLNVAPVKSLGLEHPSEMLLGPAGVRENRRFFLVGADGRLFRGAYHGPLVRVRPEYDGAAERLALRFPDGERVEADARGEEEVVGDFWGRPVPGRALGGRLAEALSDFAGKPIRIVRAGEDGIGTDALHSVSLLGDGSLNELAGRIGREVDPRRFRMLIELSGVDPRAEDGWDGKLLQLGEAVVLVRGPVGRCANITHDPDTGARDLDLLHAIKAYRGVVDGAICFGVYGDVVEPGRVRVGDPVSPAS